MQTKSEVLIIYIINIIGFIIAGILFCGVIGGMITSSGCSATNTNRGEYAQCYVTKYDNQTSSKTVSLYEIYITDTTLLYTYPDEYLQSHQYACDTYPETECRYAKNSWIRQYIWRTDCLLWHETVENRTTIAILAWNSRYPPLANIIFAEVIQSTPVSLYN